MGTPEAIADGLAYDSFMGRWSGVVAREFIAWLSAPSNSSWLDVGCGTGALSATILESASPSSVCGIDPAGNYIDYVQSNILDSRARFEVGDALALPFGERSFDIVVSGLVLNQITAPAAAVAEMARVTRIGGLVAAYVWDFAGGMQLLRYFWDTAIELDPAAEVLDQGRRFPLCHPDKLYEVFGGAWLEQVEVRPIDVPTVFRDFDDYWLPFLSGHGLRAPGYVMSLSARRRSALEQRIRAALPIDADGSIHLVARAWAVRGSNSGQSGESAA